VARRRLEKTVETLSLKSISLAPINSGGYSFSHSVNVPSGGNLYLCLESVTNRLDLAGGYNATKLPALLKCIGAVEGWGKSIRCWLVLEQNGQTIGESAATDMQCPVKPYDGAFTLQGFGSAQPKLTYPGNGTGRLLTAAIDGKHYFRFGSKFETDNALRGFDCTTFIMALFQCNIDMSGKYGTYLVEKLGCTKCDMEQKKEKEVKAFFADATKGAMGQYIMWSEGHMLVAKNAVLHEFTYGGYVQTPAATFPRYNKAANGLWWIRKLPATYSP
jgi:hypothetical protein